VINLTKHIRNASHAAPKHLNDEMKEIYGSVHGY